MVFDVQDAGARFYTYMSTMAYAMEAAAQKGIEFVVLDRPNPISASRLEGPVMDSDLRSFTGYFPLPVRHGMTLGELARMFNGENRMGVRLTVIPMQGYRRDMWFDETGLAWVNPSPNLRSSTRPPSIPGWLSAKRPTSASAGARTRRSSCSARRGSGPTNWCSTCEAADPRGGIRARRLHARFEHFCGATVQRHPHRPQRSREIERGRARG